jgi:hypothetical protein
MRFGLAYRFRVGLARIAALGAASAALLQIEIATIGKSDSGLRARVVGLPAETQIRLSSELPSVRCWLKLGLDMPYESTRLWRAKLNGVSALRAFAIGLSNGGTEIQVRTRTVDRAADSVFSWGVGDDLELITSPATHPSPRVTSWDLFRADGTEQLNDSNGRAGWRLALDCLQWTILSITLLAIFFGIGVDEPRRESFRDKVISDQIDLIDWGDRQRTKWMRELITRVIDPEANETLDQAIGHLSVRDPAIIQELKRNYRAKLNEVIVGYQKYVLDVIEPPAAPPTPPAQAAPPAPAHVP